MFLTTQLNSSSVADLTQHLAVMRIDEDKGIALVGATVTIAEWRAVGRFAIGGRSRARNHRHGRGDDLRGLSDRGAVCDDVAVGKERVVDLVLEEIEASGDREVEQEGNDEQAGEEMPAPDGAIEGNLADAEVGP